MCSLRIEQFVWLIYLLLCCMKSFVLQSPKVSRRAGRCCARALLRTYMELKAIPPGKQMGHFVARC